MHELLKIYPELLHKWNEHWRYYHNIDHLNQLLDDINLLNVTANEKSILEIIAIFHDIEYYPWQDDNEALSIKYFINFNDKYKYIKNKRIIDTIIEAIERTGDHEKCNSKISDIFRKLDRKILHSDFKTLLEYETKIFKEFQFCNYLDYKIARINFLNSALSATSNNEITQLISYVQNKKPNIAIYPGSFNPFHIGHYNILQKAEKIFDKVIIAKGVNPEKIDIKKDTKQRQFINPSQKENNKIINREFYEFSGMLTDELEYHQKYSNITLIRGLRNGKDLDYEVNQLRFMETMKPDMQVSFIMCDNEFTHISSSAIRNIAKLDYTKASEFVI